MQNLKCGVIVALSAGIAAASVPAANAATDRPRHTTTLNVLAFNDFHGHIDDNGAALACLIEQRRYALGKNTVLVSSGDNVGGSPFVSASAQDVPTMQYLNTLGVRASAVGNHEFDKGFSDVAGRIAKTQRFPLLGANVYRAGTTIPAMKSYSIERIDGVRIAFVGAITADTPNIVMPDGVKSLTFGDPVAAVNRVSARLKDGNPFNGEADVVVASYHSGASVAPGASYADALASDAEFNAIATKTSAAVDAILNAHTHSTYAFDAPRPGGGTRPLVQGSSYGKMLTQVQLDYDRRTRKVTASRQTNLPTKGIDLTTCAGKTRYARASAIIEKAVAAAKVTGNVVVGTQTGDILRRQGESALANLDAQVWLDRMNAAGRPGADIGIMNPGGVRADLPFAPTGTEKPGEITFAEAFAVNPFANTLQTVTLTGAQFRMLLEQQWTGKTGTQVVPMLGLSKNVRYTYDASKPEGSRVQSVTVNGKEVAAADSFRVASGSFLIGGGDGYSVVKQGKNRVDTGLNDADEFVAWLKEHSPVTPDLTPRGTTGG